MRQVVMPTVWARFLSARLCVLVLAAWVVCVFPALGACRNLVLACSIIRTHLARSRRKNYPSSRRVCLPRWMRRRGGVFADCGSA